MRLPNGSGSRLYADYVPQTRARFGSTTLHTTSGEWRARRTSQIPPAGIPVRTESVFFFNLCDHSDLGSRYERRFPPVVTFSCNLLWYLTYPPVTDALGSLRKANSSSMSFGCGSTLCTLSIPSGRIQSRTLRLEMRRSPPPLGETTSKADHRTMAHILGSVGVTHGWNNASERSESNSS